MHSRLSHPPRTALARELKVNVLLMSDKNVGITGHRCGLTHLVIGQTWISTGGMREPLNNFAVNSYGWAQLKLAASSKLPAPEYFATCG
jgi:hypothetical protein